MKQIFFITFISLFFVLGNDEIVTLIYHRIDLQWLRNNYGTKKFIYDNYKLIFCRIIQHNEKKLKTDIYKYTEVLPNITTSQNKYVVSDVN